MVCNKQLNKMAATTAAMKTPFTSEEIRFLDLVEDYITDDAIDMIENGFNVNFQDEDGNTALMQMASKEDICGRVLDGVTKLIGLGADLNIQNVKGETALMLALRYSDYEPGRINMVRTLIKYGVDLNIQTNRGYTSLYYAYSYRPNLAMVKLLVENGADVLVRDRRGRRFVCLEYEEEEEDEYEDEDEDEYEECRSRIYLKKKMKEALRMRLIKKRLEVRAVRVGEEVLGLTRDEYMEKLHEDHKMAEELSKVDE